MNMRAKLNGWSLGAGIVIGLLVGFSISHRHHHGPGPHGDPFHGKDLTEDERAKVHEIAKSSMDEDRPKMNQLDELSRKLRDRLQSKDAKDEDLKRDFAVVNDLRHDLAARRFEMDLKVRQAIGPDRINGFDPMGPPQGMRGPHGLGGPHEHHGPPGPPPPDEREHGRDEE